MVYKQVIRFFKIIPLCHCKEEDQNSSLTYQLIIREELIHDHLVTWLQRYYL